MPDAFEDQAWVRLGVAGALAREYAADQRHFLALLTQALEKALPGEVETRHSGFFGNKRLSEVAVSLGAARFTLEDPGKGPLQAKRTHIVRGIALKSEEISVEQALAEIGEALDERSKTSEAARNALASMLGLS